MFGPRRDYKRELSVTESTIRLMVKFIMVEFVLLTSVDWRRLPEVPEPSVVVAMASKPSFQPSNFGSAAEVRNDSIGSSIAVQQ